MINRISDDLTGAATSAAQQLEHGAAEMSANLQR